MKEKELEALLAGEHDSCSCFIEVDFSFPFAIVEVSTFKIYSLKIPLYNCFICQGIHNLYFSLLFLWKLNPVMFGLNSRFKLELEVLRVWTGLQW